MSQETMLRQTTLGALRARGRAVRRLARWLWLPALVMIAGIAGAVLWWATCLRGLPDIGDPFDVAAFQSQTMPEAENAFVLYRQAGAKLKGFPGYGGRAPSRASSDPLVTWSDADPALRAWVEENSEPLVLFRLGAERPGGLSSPGEPRDFWGYYHDLTRLALLEGSRHEELGDFAGAWTWYRAILRTAAHIREHGTAMERFGAVQGIHSLLRRRVATWAGDPKTDADLLRHALRDVRAVAPKDDFQAEVYTLKCEYLGMMRQLDDRHGMIHDPGPEDVPAWARAWLPASPERLREFFALRRFISREPERSRRVLRLAFANWLAAVEGRSGGMPKPAVRALFRVWRQNWGLDLYSASRGMAPEALARWILTTRDARRLLVHWPWPTLRHQERLAHRGLVILLAEEVYRRERGEYPPSEQALVGTYLDRLPDDGAVEWDATMVPTVDDPTIAASPPGR